MPATPYSRWCGVSLCPFAFKGSAAGLSHPPARSQVDMKFFADLASELGLGSSFISRASNEPTAIANGSPCLCGNAGPEWGPLVSCESCRKGWHPRCVGLHLSTTSAYRCALCRARDVDPFLIHLPNDLACYFEPVPHQPVQPVRPWCTGILGSALIGAHRRHAGVDVTLSPDQIAMLNYKRNTGKPPYVLRISSFLGTPRKKLHNHRWPLQPSVSVNMNVLQVRLALQLPTPSLACCIHARGLVRVQGLATGTTPCMLVLQCSAPLARLGGLCASPCPPTPVPPPPAVPPCRPQLSHAPPMWDGRSTNDRNIDLPLEVPAHLLVPGKNRIYFTASDPEPHILVAELLVRRSAEQLKQEVFSKRTLSTQVARAHVRASFDRMGLGGSADADDDDEIEASSVQLTLHCPLTRMRIALPCRGVGCSHIECFDLDAYMQACACVGRAGLVCGQTCLCCCRAAPPGFTARAHSPHSCAGSGRRPQPKVAVPDVFHLLQARQASRLLMATRYPRSSPG